ncbi:demethylmenaquinone methyltransferase [Leifsonia sp. AG29]|uniref:demethylmenaquinone methyltransferase n=1 Tax=Leifsonia sp. AG29 TaxID=2598860 RepID=UPI00131C4BC5|nr:demethylmenaquinone methyltransferase [Leifsonia sp. AG29]
MSKADLSKQPAQVAAMFDEVSTHYDRTNTVLSMGNAALWRVATTRAVAPAPGERILDVAAGTGTSSASLARNGASVVAADFSAGMIEVGRERQAGNPYVSFVQADATALPFPDDSFDAVTISFGLRNIVDPRAALAEFFRVTKPGGRVVICEFSRPPLGPIRAGYNAYLRYGMPVLAKAASSNPAAYEYLMESIQAWPSQPELAAWLREAGFDRVAYRNLTAGIVALHRGWKPLAVSSAAPTAVKSNAATQTAAQGDAASPTAAKPAAAKPAPAEPTPAKPAAESPAAKSTAAKSPAAKSTAAKSPAAKSTAAKSAAAKSTAAKSAAAKPTADKPAAAKSTAAKPAAAKSSGTKPRTRTSTGSASGTGTAKPTESDRPARSEDPSSIPPEGE